MPVQRPTPPSRPRGFSLIELLLVLGVLAILLVAMFVLYPQVRMDNQVRAEISRVQQIHAAISTAFRGQGINIAGSSGAQQAAMNTVLRSAGVIPRGQASVTHEWGGVLRVYPIRGRLGSAHPCGRDPRGAMLQYESLPAQACTKLATRLLGDPQKHCYISVSGATLLWSQGYTPSEPTPGAVAAACSTQGQATGVVTLVVGMR